MVTSYCRFVRLSTRAFVTSIQLVVLKSEFFCNTKSSAGTIHERWVFVCKGVMPNNGVGVDCEM